MLCWAHIYEAPPARRALGTHTAVQQSHHTERCAAPRVTGTLWKAGSTQGPANGGQLRSPPAGAAPVRETATASTRRAAGSRGHHPSSATHALCVSPPGRGHSRAGASPEGDFPAWAASLPRLSWNLPEDPPRPGHSLPLPLAVSPAPHPGGRDGLGLGPQGPAAFPSAGGTTRASAELGRPAAAGPSPPEGSKTPGGSRAQPCAPSPGGACPPAHSRLGDGERVLLPPHPFRDGARGLSAQRATQAGPGTRQPLRRDAAGGGGACPGNKRGATSGAPAGSARGALGTAPAPVAERPPAHPDPRCRRRRLLREMGTLRPLPPSCCDFGAHDLGGWHTACPTGTQGQRETPRGSPGRRGDAAGSAHRRVFPAGRSRGRGLGLDHRSRKEAGGAGAPGGGGSVRAAWAGPGLGPPRGRAQGPRQGCRPAPLSQLRDAPGTRTATLPARPIHLQPPGAAPAHGLAPPARGPPTRSPSCRSPPILRLPGRHGSPAAGLAGVTPHPLRSLRAPRTAPITTTYRPCNTQSPRPQDPSF